MRHLLQGLADTLPDGRLQLAHVVPVVDERRIVSPASMRSMACMMSDHMGLPTWHGKLTQTSPIHA